VFPTAFISIRPFQNMPPFYPRTAPLDVLSSLPAFYTINFAILKQINTLLRSIFMPAKRIGILTGGGDVPGLNSVIKSVVYRGAEIDCEIIGIRRGWEGLTHVDLKDPASKSRYIQPLNRENTRTIDRTGGTYLHSSRTNPTKMQKLPPALVGQQFPSRQSTKKGVTSTVYDVTPAVLKNIEALGLDYIVAIGGDDTLSYAAELNRQGVKIVAVPKTMDNDVHSTEYCIGFSTAITRAMDAIERQRTTVGSHERIGIFRVFGRDAGYTALYTAYVTSVRCCIPEYKVNLQHLIEILITDKRNNPSNYSLVILSEGAEWEGYTVKEYGPADAFGHRKKMSVAEDLSDEIKNATGDETVVSDLTYDLRSGSPDFVDRMVATTYAGMAMDAVQEGKTGLMAAIRSGCFTMVPIPDPKLGPRKVDVATMYNTERYRPTYDRKLGLPIFLTRA
jgi:ATP-dependent phosphofructokinase / diphosphate-dependent phosphofructokinase